MQIHVKVVTRNAAAWGYWCDTLVPSITAEVAASLVAWWWALTLLCTTSGGVFLSGKAEQFPAVAVWGLITMLWRNHDSFTWWPRATDPFFFPFPPLSLTKNCISTAGRIIFLRNWIIFSLIVMQKSLYISCVTFSHWCKILINDVCMQRHVNALQYLDFVCESENEIKILQKRHGRQTSVCNFFPREPPPPANEEGICTINIVLYV